MTKQQTSSATKAANLDPDFADLDALINESVAIAAATKAAKAGRKLSAAQLDLLESSKIAVEVAKWTPIAAYAHFAATSCACGNHFVEFRGWYHYEEQRGGCRRLIRRDTANGLAVARYTTEVVVGFCEKCAPVGLREASPKDLDLLAELGTPAPQQDPLSDLERLDAILQVTSTAAV